MPEAPRLIGHFTWTYQKLPFHLQAKGEFEYVGRKLVGNGCDESNPNDLTSYCLGVPNKEFRLVLSRPFYGNRGRSRGIGRENNPQTVRKLVIDDRYRKDGRGTERIADG